MPGRLAEQPPAARGEVLTPGARQRWALLVRRLEDLYAAFLATQDARYHVLQRSLGPLAVGTFIAYDSGWLVADNTDGARRARLVVVGPAPRGYLATGERMRLRWASHGIGAAGTEFWLGTAGGVVTAEPQGPTVRVAQRLGIALDADHVLLEWDTPTLEVP